MSRIEYNPSLNDRVNGQLGDLGVEIQIPLSSIKELIVPPAPEAPYKVFTALVSQSGNDNSQTIDTGLLTIGVSYRIDVLSPGMDFTNVGAPNNNINTYFIATGTTPASWGSNEGIGNETLRYNLGAPTVVLLLENTIGNVWFTYQTDGYYFINSDNLFTLYKTVSINDQTVCYDAGSGEFYSLRINADGPSIIGMFTKDDTNLDVNSRLTDKLIEIRVYN